MEIFLKLVSKLTLELFKEKSFKSNDFRKILLEPSSTKPKKLSGLGS